MLLPKVTTLQHSELSVTGVTAVSLRHAALLYVNIAAPRHSSHASTLPASHSRGGGCLIQKHNHLLSLNINRQVDCGIYYLQLQMHMHTVYTHTYYILPHFEFSINLLAFAILTTTIHSMILFKILTFTWEHIRIACCDFGLKCKVSCFYFPSEFS